MKKDNEMKNEQKATVPDLKEFVRALGALAVLEGKVAKRPVDDAFVRQLKHWATGLFRVVVMGEIKKGKSSFINALLGVRDLVPVDSNVATSTIYKICYGEKVSYKVFFSEESKKPCVVIDKEALPSYGTEDGNHGNEKQVDFIQVFVPSDFLRNGLVIIDTPGLGGLFKQHKRITYEYVPRADAVFLVSDSVESPIGKAELDLLDDLKNVTDQIYFVQTKAMAVDAEARKSRELNNRRTLERHGFNPDTLKYFVVDSHLKLDADAVRNKEDLIDSGFVPLAMFINNELKANVHRHIMRKALQVAMPKFAAIETALAEDGKVLSADSETARRKIADELAAAEAEAENWQSHELPRLQDRLQDGMREIKAKVADRTRRFRPGGEVQEMATQVIASAEDRDALFQRLAGFSDNAANMFTQERHNALVEVRTEIEKLLRELLGASSPGLADMAADDGDVAVNTAPVQRVVEANGGDNFFDNARTVMYGGMAGAGMAAIVGGLIGSIVPGVGTIIGSTVGTLMAGGWGGLMAHNIKKSNELEKAKQQAVSAIAQAISSAYQNLNESIQRAVSDIEFSVMRAVRDAATRRRDDLAARRKELRQRQTESSAQLNEKRKQLDGYSREFAAIKEVAGRVV